MAAVLILEGPQIIISLHIGAGPYMAFNRGSLPSFKYSLSVDLGMPVASETLVMESPRFAKWLFKFLANTPTSYILNQNQHLVLKFRHREHKCSN